MGTAKWDKENTVVIAAKLMRKTDSDIIEYLVGKKASGVIKKALRLLMELEPDESE